MIPRFRAYDGGSLNRMYQPDEVMVGNGDIWIIDEESVRPKKYPYSGKRKRQKIPSPLFSARPIFKEVPIVEEVKVEFKVEASTGRIYPETIIHLDISGYGNRVHSVHRFPGILLSVGESIQLKILFYKKLRDFTTDRFLTFRESDWKFFIRDLVNEFAH